MLHVLPSLPLQAEENQSEPQILTQFSLEVDRSFPTAPCFPKPDCLPVQMNFSLTDFSLVPQ